MSLGRWTLMKARSSIPKLLLRTRPACSLPSARARPKQLGARHHEHTNLESEYHPIVVVPNSLPPSPSPRAESLPTQHVRFPAKAFGRS